MEPYDSEFRADVLAACDANEGTRTIAVRFKVSDSWVRRIKQQRRETGQVSPKNAAPRKPKWHDWADWLLAKLAARPAGLRRDTTVARTTNALASAPDTEAWQTGNQLLASGQWWPAIAAYQRAYAHTPDPALAHNLALALTAAGEHVAAQHWQQRAGEHP